MIFDLNQPPTAEISESALETAMRSLEESLVPSRREYAYMLANIRRLEQKYKQVSCDLDGLHVALEVAKLQKNIEQYNLTLTRHHNCQQMLVSLRGDHHALTQRARDLKNQISNTEGQIAEIQAETKNRRIRLQNAQRKKYFYMALGVIDTTLIVNVIEYPVLQEAILQHSQLPIDLRIKIKPVEVAAFALNRLPHMYASNKNDYDRQLHIVKNEFKSKIYDAVKRAIQALVTGDPLHDSTPLPEEVFCDRAGLLGQLCLLFNRKLLRWREIPGLLNKLNDQSTQEQSSGSFTSNRYAHIKKYLQRTKLRTLDSEQSVNFDSSSNQDLFLELYVLKGKLKFINAIEKLVVVAILHLMVEIPISESEFAAVAAQTLNQFQPMYATSHRGLDYLCKRFFKEEFKNVLAQIRYGHTRSKLNSSTSLDFEQFNLEYQNIVTEITQILNRDDLTPENLVSLIAEHVQAF